MNTSGSSIMLKLGKDPRYSPDYSIIKNLRNSTTFYQILTLLMIKIKVITSKNMYKQQEDLLLREISKMRIMLICESAYHTNDSIPMPNFNVVISLISRFLERNRKLQSLKKTSSDSTRLKICENASKHLLSCETDQDFRLKNFRLLYQIINDDKYKDATWYEALKNELNCGCGDEMIKKDKYCGISVINDVGINAVSSDRIKFAEKTNKYNLKCCEIKNMKIFNNKFDQLLKINSVHFNKIKNELEDSINHRNKELKNIMDKNSNNFCIEDDKTNYKEIKNLINDQDLHLENGRCWVEGGLFANSSICDKEINGTNKSKFDKKMSRVLLKSCQSKWRDTEGSEVLHWTMGEESVTKRISDGKKDDMKKQDIEGLDLVMMKFDNKIEELLLHNTNRNMINRKNQTADNQKFYQNIIGLEVSKKNSGARWKPVDKCIILLQPCHIHKDCHDVSLMKRYTLPSHRINQIKIKPSRENMNLQRFDQRSIEKRQITRHAAAEKIQRAFRNYRKNCLISALKNFQRIGSKLNNYSNIGFSCSKANEITKYRLNKNKFKEDIVKLYEMRRARVQVNIDV